MGFTAEHGHELAEITALTRRLDQRAKECLDKLERIGEAQRGPRSRPRGTRRKGLARPEGEPLLAFVHIPKTAGGTVISMLATAYSKDGIRDGGNYFRNPAYTTRKVARPKKSRGRVLAGHVPYGVLREHLPPDTRYMTFLREPVDRVFSHYWRHVRRRDPARAGRMKQRPGARVKAESIAQAVTEMRIPQMNNFAMRFLCARPPVSGSVPPSALDEAKENLREFAFIGIQERFEESLLLLQRMLGLDSVAYEDRHVSSDRPAVEDLTDEERRVIEEHNQLDAELYRFGLQLFNEAITRADQRQPVVA